VPELVGLQHLTWLNLDKTQITDKASESLAQMSQLEWLHLGSNPLTDASVPNLLKLTGLKYLNISHTQITQERYWDLDDAIAARGGTVVGP
jgi:Leucine-rich repeat (LRR) protein